MQCNVSQSQTQLQITILVSLHCAFSKSVAVLSTFSLHVIKEILKREVTVTCFHLGRKLPLSLSLSLGLLGAGGCGDIQMLKDPLCSPSYTQPPNPTISSFPITSRLKVSQHIPHSVPCLTILGSDSSIDLRLLYLLAMLCSLQIAGLRLMVPHVCLHGPLFLAM